MESETIAEGLKKYGIGAKLQRLRFRKSMGLVELSRHTGLSPALLPKLERGVMHPTLPTLLRIALVFSVGLDYFFIPEPKPVLEIVRKLERLRFPDSADVAYYFESLDFPVPQRILNSYFAEFASRGSGSQSAESSTLPALLSKVLLSIALEFESQVKLSLAIYANVLRICPDEGLPMRELPRLSGVSKEAIAMAVKYLAKQGYASIESRNLALTTKGLAARQACQEALSGIEECRGERPSATGIRTPLERLVSGLHRGIEPHPECWRASFPTPETLPHFPMVLHRGGFPDGS